MKKAKKPKTLAAFAATRPSKVQTCKACSLPPKIRRELERELAAGMANTVASEGMKLVYDIRISDSAIRRHRRGACRGKQQEAK